MISFACPHCQQKLNVKDELAGRTAPCPACKKPLTVPASAKGPAPGATSRLDGTASVLAQTGVAGRVSLDTGSDTPQGQPALADLLAQRTGKGERYILAGEIARGGMGAVLRAIDCDLRREVAVKHLLDASDPKKQLRFVEEAQITGQLEHPNIPPIHEMGVEKQRLFFSMKMIKGRSLAQVLSELRDQPKTAEKEWPLSRLLNIFVSICHAVGFAHAHSVIHRDLKPANIMVGDFGEVYVMDWGLAKVLSGSGQQAEEPLTAVLPPDGKVPPRVATDRTPGLEMTQEGAILGTPVYMPPEQAAGNLQAIDQRSDVYSLGAILYELLTLEPPVEMEGGAMSVLVQVVQGQIVPPEQRVPQRAKSGRIPRELSAVAMKALAKEPADRYPSVEELRRDIERYQEGWSVSAKADSNWELVWKLVKRNKAASLGAAAVLLVLLTSLVLIFQAWRETSVARDALKQEQAEKEKAQAEKRKQLVESVPALVRSARLLANDGEVEEAQRQVDLALEYAKTHAPAHLLKGQLFVAEKKWEAGRTQLEQYLKLQPGDADAQELHQLCAKGRKEDTVFLVEVAEVFQKQRLFGVAARLLKDAAKSVEARQPLLALYRKQIEKAYPGQGGRLTLEPNGRFRLNFVGYQELDL